MVAELVVWLVLAEVVVWVELAEVVVTSVELELEVADVVPSAEDEVMVVGLELLVVDEVDDETEVEDCFVEVWLVDVEEL